MHLLKWYKKDKKIILISLLIGLIVATGFTTYNTKLYSDTIHSGLEQNLIRFHVIANSDSEADQQLKLKVRDKILEVIKPLLDKSTSVTESKQILLDNKDLIKQISEQIIAQEGKNYNVNVNLQKSNFPTKKYGDIILPAGEYESLKVVIGKGEGKNWWCVMFPPLCFVDITHGTVPEESKEELKNVLTEEEYDLVSLPQNETDIPVKVKFKIVEWWQKNKEVQTIFAHK